VEQLSVNGNWNVQVALARHALDPLAVLSALFTPANEILSLSLHPLQSAIPADDLLRTYETVMITAVSQV
jgi:transcriptional accessory protein Tex/SPT6